MKTLFTLFLTITLATAGSADLEKKKLEIDQYMKKHSKQFFLFAKVPKKKELVRVDNDKWPEEVECSYNILKDAAGKVIFIAQIPYSESGDWNINYSYYFNPSGELFCFNRFTGFFNSGCTDDAAHETITKYYNRKFNIVSNSYILTDSKKRPLNKLKCAFPYEFKDYKIYKNVNECLKAFNIKL